ncbi:SUR7 domain containing protein [Asbolus verrucosus]|uniref:SUR7 domain containing protein n=1 Tax=Asbolus verrucosus TaxID=1661398 RepID=A0A482VC20_ASBVE|nr:SUR7 domain containing protein [Asbolus verrucosus]
MDSKFENDYDWQANQPDMINILPGDMETDINNYNLDDSDNTNLFNQKQMLYNEPSSKSNRDPRSKEDITKVHSEVNTNQKKTQSKKKNLQDPKYGVYDYQNVKKARNRLLHDLNNLPSEILRDTYFKNRESQLRKSKFEQRDITSHIDKMKQNKEVKNVLDEERKSADNYSYTLWDLESEKELQDKENGYWRGKREVNYTFNGIRKISSVEMTSFISPGAIVKSLDTTNNAIDVIFITYWVPTGFGNRETLDQEISDCIEEKLANGSEDQAHSYQKTTEDEQRALYTRECISRMTVYRLRIECTCDVLAAGERCAKFLPQTEQNWSMYLGKFGDGFFHARN